MARQIVDATLVRACKQHTAAERQAIRASRTVTAIRPNNSTKPAQKGTGARWTLKFAKASALSDRWPWIDIAIPSLDLRAASRPVGTTASFDAARSPVVLASTDGCCAPVTRDNMASDVWADMTYRSHANEAWMKAIGRVSRI